MTDPQGSLRPPITELSVQADESNLSQLRAMIGASLHEHGADAELIDLVVLAASELATNVIQHTSSPTISVAIGRVADGWCLEVANADGIKDLDSFTTPPQPSNVSGRGLSIVHAVMDRVYLAAVDDTKVVRCVKIG